MKKIVFLLVLFFFFSCSDKDARQEQSLKLKEKQTDVFNTISSNWNFKTAEFNEDSFQEVLQWLEWNSFYNELLQKPQTDLGAYKRKAATLVKQSEALLSTIPDIYNNTQIQSRIIVLESKIKVLDMYLRVEEIPVENVIDTISEINTEVQSIVSRMNTILVKNAIQQEEGEAEMLQKIKVPEVVEPELPVY